jgi:hypothetical protein
VGSIAAVALFALAFASSASAVAPWDGSPISPGLGPTYGEESAWRRTCRELVLALADGSVHRALVSFAKRPCDDD